VLAVEIGYGDRQVVLRVQHLTRIEVLVNLNIYAYAYPKVTSSIVIHATIDRNSSNITINKQISVATTKELGICMAHIAVE